MELRKRLNPKIVFVCAYILAFVAYIIYGLQPAEAVQDEGNLIGQISIPSIGLNSDVVGITPIGQEIPTPNSLVGGLSLQPNKTLLVGHSTTVFSELKDIRLGDKILYNNKSYTVSKVSMMLKEAVSMRNILKGAEVETIDIMTCAGKIYSDGDASFRLIVEATAD